jgi:hypothetical protein
MAVHPERRPDETERDILVLHLDDQREFVEMAAGVRRAGG